MCQQPVGEGGQIGVNACLRRECVWQGLSHKLFALAGQHQMWDATARRSCLCITQGVAHRMNFLEVDTKAVANLFEQPRQRFSALSVFIWRVGAVKNRINTATRFGQGLVHFVVH